MSAQTGTPSYVPPPPASGTVGRARTSIRRAQNDPNPIWIRELKQAARLQRTPIILMTITSLVALLMCAIGGIMSVTSAPASTGVALFHTFFSVAFFVVTLVGPALAANSVASEREGRTWEAVLLTGLAPKAIAKGKFLSALTSICLYIVMLAPVGALSFLFGGVTVLEVVVAFAFLVLFAVLSVAFGLAISSAMASGRTAIVVTLLLAFPLTLAVYFGLGVGVSFAAHEAWSSVLGGPPVWLPTAYERAPFSAQYFTFLVLIPVASVALPAWFFYEVTVANLTSISDDRTTGLKRWFAVMTPLLTAAAIVPVLISSSTRPSSAFALSISALFVFLVFCTFVFQGDALGPSRRVLVHWSRQKASAISRFFGPGLINTSELLLVLGLASLASVAAAGTAFAYLSPYIPVGSHQLEAERVISFAGYAAAYFMAIVGFGAWVRARSTTPSIARVMLLVAIFFSTAGPWIIAAIAGILSDGAKSDSLVVAAPSPLFAFVLFEALDDASRSIMLLAGGICSAAWVLIGLGLLQAAASRCRSVIRRHNEMLEQAEAIFAQEDAAQAAAVAPEASASPAPWGPASQ